MKAGLFCAISGEMSPALAAKVARGAEERGFYSLWAPEHVMFFEEYKSRYPYNESGMVPAGEGGVVDSLIALSWLAASTSTIRLGTGICILPQRNPIYTARHAADVDFLSGGRLELGVGIGWLKEEFEALGVPFERRGDRTREYADILKTLWTEDRPSYQGEFFDVPKCIHAPKPVQTPHPPIIFGGNSNAALRRAADVGQGWYGFNLTLEEFAERKSKLTELLTAQGKSVEDFSIYITPPGGRVDADMINRYEDLGADQLITMWGARTEEKAMRQLDGAASAFGL